MYDPISSIIQKQFYSAQNIDKAKPSCLAVAVWRAAHQIFEQPNIFHDPVALKILGDAKTEVMDKVDLHKDPLSSAMRIAIVVRSRLAEDEREKFLHEGAVQYVILGAGLDTYAYRSSCPNEYVFEVDLPATQEIKISRVQQFAIQPTCNIRYVACDFEENSLASSLLAADFDKNQKAFFSWLGVVPYLDVAAIEQTLQFIASCASGSAVVFDYIVDPNILSEMEKMVINVLSAQVAAGGEPLKSFFEPQMLTRKLADSGFTNIEDIGPEYLNERYLASRKDDLRVGNVTRMFKAVV